MEIEILDKLERELSELIFKTNKLEKFLVSEEIYYKVSSNHKQLLRIQFNIMLSYIQVLESRIKEIKGANSK